MNKVFYCLMLIAVSMGCKGKKKTKTDIDNSKFFPALSFLQAEVKDVDTSLYHITKVETVNNISDTLVISREDFRKYASPFLQIPDITAEKWKGAYTETTHYDTSMGRAFLIYNAIDADTELKRQDITVMPTFGGNDEVKTIFIHTVNEGEDSTIEKKMYWEVKKYFSIVTLTQKDGVPEQVKKLQVFWQ